MREGGERGVKASYGLRKDLQLSSRYGLSEPQNMPDRNTGSGSDVVPYTATNKHRNRSGDCNNPRREIKKEREKKRSGRQSV